MCIYSVYTNSMCLPLKGESHLFTPKYHAETKALAKDIQRWVAILEYNAFFFPFQEKEWIPQRR